MERSDEAEEEGVRLLGSDREKWRPGGRCPPDMDNNYGGEGEESLCLLDHPPGNAATTDSVGLHQMTGPDHFQPSCILDLGPVDSPFSQSGSWVTCQAIAVLLVLCNGQMLLSYQRSILDVCAMPVLSPAGMDCSHWLWRGPARWRTASEMQLTGCTTATLTLQYVDSRSGGQLVPSCL